MFINRLKKAYKLKNAILDYLEVRYLIEAKYSDNFENIFFHEILV